MKNKELETVSREELKSRLTELRKELIKHNAQISTGTIPKSPGIIRKTKKNIARILTILNKKETKNK